MGGTAESVGKVWNRNLTQIGVYTIAVHEVENLLPIGFVKKMSKTNKEARNFLSKLLQSKNLKFIGGIMTLKRVSVSLKLNLLLIITHLQRNSTRKFMALSSLLKNIWLN